MHSRMTKAGFLYNLKNLSQNDINLKNWYQFINIRFLEHQIGWYCVQNRISAGDAIIALNKMLFSEYCEKVEGDFIFHQYRLKQKWLTVKAGKEEDLLTDFIKNLPIHRTQHREPPISPKKSIPFTVSTATQSTPIESKSSIIDKNKLEKVLPTVVSKPIVLVNSKKYFLESFKQLERMDHVKTDENWYWLIKDNFIGNTIGYFCIKNQISAGDARIALKKMNFEEFCEINSGSYEFHGHTKTDKWPRIKKGHEYELISAFTKNLPEKKCYTEILPQENVLKIIHANDGTPLHFTDCQLSPLKTKSHTHEWLYAENNKYLSHKIDTSLTGKWIIHLQKDQVEEQWMKIKQLVIDKKLWKAKVSCNNPRFNDFVICIDVHDSYDYSLIVDAYRALDEANIIPSGKTIYYKTDEQTSHPEQGEYTYTSKDISALMLGLPGYSNICEELKELNPNDRHEGIRNIVASVTNDNISYSSIIDECRYRTSSTSSIGGFLKHSILHNVSPRSDAADLLYRAFAEFNLNTKLFSKLSTLPQLLIAQQKRDAINVIHQEIKRLSLPSIGSGLYGGARVGDISQLANDKIIAYRKLIDLLVSSSIDLSLQVVLQDAFKNKQELDVLNKTGGFKTATSKKVITELLKAAEPNDMIETLKNTNILNLKS